MIEIPKEFTKFAQDPESVATITHLGANFVPLPIGAVFDAGASMLDEGVAKENIVRLWGKEIARKLNVKESDLQGDEGLQLISANIDSLPEWMRTEWEAAEDIEGKTGKFLVGNTTTFGAMGLAAGAVGGGILGMVAGFPAGMLAGKLGEDAFKEITGRTDSLNTSQIVSAIHLLAEKEQQEAEKHDQLADIPPAAVSADKTLIATLLITMSPAEFKDIDQEALLKILPDHIQKKEQEIAEGKTSERTELEEAISTVEDRFVGLLPENVQGKMPVGTTTLDIIAANIHSQDDMNTLLFEPEKFKELVAQRIKEQEVHSAGVALHQAMNIEHAGDDGALSTAPRSRRHDGPSRN